MWQYLTDTTEKHCNGMDQHCMSANSITTHGLNHSSTFGFARTSCFANLLDFFRFQLSNCCTKPFSSTANPYGPPCMPKFHWFKNLQLATKRPKLQTSDLAPVQKKTVTCRNRPDWLGSSQILQNSGKNLTLNSQHIKSCSGIQKTKGSKLIYFH